MDTVSILATIAHQGKLSKAGLTADERELVKLQCMKARMALAFLLGSDAIFGQANSLGLKKGNLACVAIETPEVEQLTEVLGHALYRRSKPHPGGYSATTFSVKYILWSIQCLLLSQPKNQEQFAEAGMERINALLIKILALHALQGVSFVDTEAAGYACTSLYLLSHFGFHVRDVVWLLAGVCRLRTLL
jgi:hypothetical protein